MPTTTTTLRKASRAQASGSAEEVVAAITAVLRDGLAGQPATVVLFFASASYDPSELAGPLNASFPEAAVLGCSTAGEFTDTASSTGGVSAIALPTSILARGAAALVDLSTDPAGAIATATRAVEAALGTELRRLDPTRHLGFVLIDGLHGAEEVVNEALGNAAPLLDVVGGSAGDDLAFAETWVSVGDQVSRCGAALVVCETTGPFTVLKTCTFESTAKKLRVTRADVAARTVYEFDGRPATEAYAEAIGCRPGDLDSAIFMEHPVGLMVDGVPFIRSPQQVTSDGGIKFYCQVLDGMEVEVMQSGDIVSETSAALAAAVDGLGGSASAGVLFNCILRRLELDAKDETQAFVDTFAGIPVAGFHTYGESWLGHMNQTLTGVLFS
ncbi:FIST signal transduction protein [Cellulomonas sp. KRMCY2]|uniref:FIST signal transduction protein n=1 Tax=Cellulomonas sp. KRMCY2 TaxID=1304865 RepID=UPI00045EB614|nr:FIST N-terminal domain-containing protein [Cellulomonas sp. KRMCY2]